MRFWLKEMDREKFDELKEGPLFGLDVRSEGMRDYVEIPCYPWQPSYTDPLIPDEVIDKVTIRTNVSGSESQLKPDGQYAFGGAELMAHRNLERSGREVVKNEKGYPLYRQSIDVSGPNVAAVKDIFIRFRDGNLTPVKDWTGSGSPESEGSESKEGGAVGEPSCEGAQAAV